MKIPQEFADKLRALQYLTQDYLKSIDRLSFGDGTTLEDLPDPYELPPERPWQEPVNPQQHILRELERFKDNTRYEAMRILRTCHALFSVMKEGAYARCDICHHYGYMVHFEKKDLITAALLDKNVCEICSEDKFFRCDKCGRLLAIDELGEKDREALCVDCCKPKGFPETIYHAMDASNDCDGLAFDSLEDVRRVLGSPDGDWIEYSDLTELTLVKKLSASEALYESSGKCRYIVGELDRNGVGDLRPAEE